VIRSGEPNFALLTTAGRTIQAFLESWESEMPRLASDDCNRQAADADGANTTLRMSPDPWNLEMGFWQDLGDLPFLGFENDDLHHEVASRSGI
jgi:hypothetical protein